MGHSRRGRRTRVCTESAHLERKLSTAPVGTLDFDEEQPDTCPLCKPQTHSARCSVRVSSNVRGFRIGKNAFLPRGAGFATCLLCPRPNCTRARTETRCTSACRGCRRHFHAVKYSGCGRF